MNAEIPAYVCSHIFRGLRPVLLVSREGGDWQFLCAGTHEDDEIPRVAGLNHLFEQDPTLEELRDLPEGWEAERTNEQSHWIRTTRVPNG